MDKSVALARLAAYWPGYEDTVRAAFASQPLASIVTVIRNAALACIAGTMWAVDPETARADLAALESKEDSMIHQPTAPTITPLIATVLRVLMAETAAERGGAAIAKAPDTRLDAALRYVVEEGDDDDLSSWAQCVAAAPRDVVALKDDNGVWHHEYAEKVAPKTAAKLSELDADDGGVPHPQGLYNDDDGAQYVLVEAKIDGDYVVVNTLREPDFQALNDALKTAAKTHKAFVKSRKASFTEAKAYLKDEWPVPAG